MLLKTFSPKVIVTAESKGTELLPMDFPWINGVSIALQGDLSDLANLQKELEEVKKLVLCDINRFKLNLKDFKITINQQASE